MFTQIVPFRVKSYPESSLSARRSFTTRSRINSPPEYTDMRPKDAPLVQLFKYTDTLSACLKSLGHTLSALGCPAESRLKTPHSEVLRAKINRAMPASLACPLIIVRLTVGAIRFGPDGALEERALFHRKPRTAAQVTTGPPVRNRLGHEGFHRRHTDLFRSQGSCRFLHAPQAYY